MSPLSFSSKDIIFWFVNVVVLMGLSPFSNLFSLARFFAAEYEVPHISDPPEMKLITFAFGGGEGALSGAFSASWVFDLFLPRSP